MRGSLFLVSLCASSLAGCMPARPGPPSEPESGMAVGMAQRPRPMTNDAPQSGQRPPFQTAVEALIELIAEPDPTRLRQFADAHMAPAYRDARPPEGHLDEIRELRGSLGRAELLDLVFETPGERRATVRSSLTGEVYDLRFRVTDDSPPKIAGIALERGRSPGSPAAAPPESLTPSARREVLERLYSSVEELYVSADTARLITGHVRAREAAGAYDDLDDPVALSRALTADLRAVNGDLHLSVRPAPRAPGGPSAPGAPEASPPYGFARVDRLPGNVGYIEVRGVLGGADEAFDVATTALRSVDGTDALILDFRENPGAMSSPRGSIIEFLVSHFVAPGTHLLDSYSRSSGETVAVRALGEVPGPRRLDVPIYVLTSPRTASGGEYIAFVLQAQGRATVVGERTAGAGRMVSGVPLAHGLMAGISVNRAWDPRSGKGWEVVGVTPDVEVPAAEAMEAALRLARQGKQKGR